MTSGGRLVEPLSPAPTSAADGTEGGIREGRIAVGGLALDPVTEHDVLRQVSVGWRMQRGGVIVTPNVDIWLRTRREPGCRSLVNEAALTVADGAPLVWAARLAGTPLPSRVTGADLVESLASLAAREHRSVFVLGGGAGDTAERAAIAMTRRHAGLRVAGHLAPPFGFDSDAAATESVVRTVVAAQPDLVLVGLGFPRQERLARLLHERLAGAWLLGCGGGVAMAAGDAARAPAWMQRCGSEWLFRLGQEPRRLAARYLVDDLPAAFRLLALAAKEGLRRRVRGTS